MNLLEFCMLFYILMTCTERFSIYNFKLKGGGLGPQALVTLSLWWYFTKL